MSVGEKRFNYTRRYVSVTPAEDWFAMYDDGNHVLFEPVVCWAATSDSDGGSCVVGLVVDTDYQELAEAGDVSFFSGYFHRKQLDAAASDIEARKQETAKKETSAN
jgi:hypothetical protein